VSNYDVNHAAIDVADSTCQMEFFVRTKAGGVILDQEEQDQLKQNLLNGTFPTL
jgi:hypothetical protein